MADIIDIEYSAENDGEMIDSKMDLVDSIEEIMSFDIINASRANTVPIDQLTVLGAGVASILPSFRTITQTTMADTTGLYRLANEAVGDTLKVAKNGNFWGAFKTAGGKSKFAQLQAADPLTATSEIVTPINPATILMAAALFSMEKSIKDIEETQMHIMSFLEIEKESEIEADVETLSGIVSNYKLNWDNEHYITSNHKMILDIQRTARRNMLSYQKIVSDIVSGKKHAIVQSQVYSSLQDLLKKFKYYRLSLNTYSLASLMEIMLGGNFKEEYISGIEAEIKTLSDTYRTIFEECSVYLEKFSGTSFEKSLLSGLGTATKAVGKLIGSIPVVKEGPVDEFLIDSGSHIKENALGMIDNIVHAFAEISNPNTHVFTERMEDMIRIFNRTKQICFNDSTIYLIPEN